ncbi:MAG: signal recognition particle-docking protein FtsY [Clostridia bacterium]|nr:signal recognition particle-docking protein FtsY [Oscillospiraceae bacterium]MBO4932670.1 signal recognition particle-docking protein FtsY [Clostridia bacterium]MBO5127346.1 signal recognition particle-docking protein FtsY [Clostridia bacterium]MBO5258585.1 signal recognition particle-docking protein FtsY [Clostridia bacterium]
MGFFDKLKQGLAKTKNAVFGQINEVVKNFRKVDEEFLEELEEIMICADMGASTTEKILDELRDRIKTDNIKNAEDVKDVLGEILRAQVGEGEPLNLETSPAVILVIGVNGVGKTTSIGKIANNLRKEGKKVIVAAADTFRAAAIEQLAIWCDRAGVELVRQNEGSDPASVVYDAIAAANKRKADVLIIDTAGRLHNKSNLMDELAKINRIISRELPNASRETLLVLDATTGQNAVMQAKKFRETAEITGLILTKLDGTAKGGAIFSIKDEINIPVKYIGVGEHIDDMQPFDAKMFIDALMKEEEKKESAEENGEDEE